MLRRALEREGHTVVEAENGRVGLARARRAAAGPGAAGPHHAGDGRLRDSSRRSGAQEAWRAVPVVVVTARDLTAEDRARLSGSVERVLQKGAPGRRDALLREIRELVAASVRRSGGER